MCHVPQPVLCHKGILLIFTSVFPSTCQSFAALSGTLPSFQGAFGAFCCAPWCPFFQMACVHQVRAQPKSCHTKVTLVYPTLLIMPSMCSYYFPSPPRCVLSLVHFGHSHFLGIVMLQLHLSHLMQRYLLLVAHHPMRCLSASAFLSTNAHFSVGFGLSSSQSVQLPRQWKLAACCRAAHLSLPLLHQAGSSLRQILCHFARPLLSAARQLAHFNP